MSQKSVCVIGAGAAGLCAVKNCIDYGLNVTAFESTKTIGGTWVYSSDVGTDEYGLHIPSSMYNGMVTNTPKEIMGYINLPLASQEDSYITPKDVLNYYHWYATEFGLLQNIRFEQNVLRVRPLASDNWEVMVMDLPSKKCRILQFDVVMVCNGRNSKPKIPKFDGHEMFGGRQFHSHDFRNADEYKGEKVCVVGAGPSGMDIVKLISEVAENVSWSYHSKRSEMPRFDNVQHKPDIRSISVGSVTFVDGTTENVDTIIYATGYRNTFPFLSIDCGLSIVNTLVHPLYKQCISVNRPTLVFIGLFNLLGSNFTFDLQAKFGLQFLTGQKKLPSKEDMLSEAVLNEFKDVAPSFPLDFAVHLKYYNALANEAGIDTVKPVIFKISERALRNAVHDPMSFRTIKFKIVDDENYEETAAGRGHFCN